MLALAYTALIDPLLRGAHSAVVGQVPTGARVLDACCGPGALSRRLASEGHDVVAVDLDAGLIDYARAEARRRRLEKLTCEVGDVTALGFGDGSFDVATVTMGLHALPYPTRRAAWAELRRVARRLVVVDYAVPLPRTVVGWGARVIEGLAGGEHHNGFRDFLGRGGLADLVNGEVLLRRRLGAGALELIVLGSSGAYPFDTHPADLPD
jgi:SAM-dependent methyltransferase